VADPRILIDTGPLVALISKNDGHHHECAETMADLTPPLLTCWPVLTKAARLLRGDAGSIQKLFGSYEAGLLLMLDLDAQAIPAIGRLMHRYRDMGAQLADAALLHLAKREDIRTIFTLDRRDF
jgi:uncharacterized protein